MKGKRKKHNISGLSFRDLSIDEEKTATEEEFIFLDGDIQEDADLKGVKKFFNLSLTY